jgi:hypothetical protein
MDIFLSFGLFSTYIHGKQRLGPLYHEIGFGRPVAGVSTYRSRISASVNNPCISVKKAMPGTIRLHVPTFHHTYTDILGTHASFLGFTMLWWSLSGETLNRGFKDLPLYLSPYEASPMDLFLSFGLFRTYIHGNQRFGPLYHGIGSGRPIARVSMYRSKISASVNSPCL